LWLTVDDWRLAVCSWQLAVGSWQLTVDSWELMIEGLSSLFYELKVSFNALDFDRFSGEAANIF
jgi:hypothetical protein